VEEPNDPNEIIRPAVEGCLSILRAATVHKVKRVVITSSLAAVVGIPHEIRPDVFNESHFSDVNWEGLKSAYERSKAIAEQKSWEYVKTTENAPELVVICPGFICGPFLSQGSSATTSISAIS
jgi:nucleoside-diphosphate-sugar epimerase